MWHHLPLCNNEQQQYLYYMMKETITAFQLFLKVPFCGNCTCHI